VVKSLTCIWLSSPRGTNRKIKGKKRTKNKSRSMISPVRSHDHEGSPGVEVIRFEGFVEKVGFEPGVKRVMDDESSDDDRG